MPLLSPTAAIVLLFFQIAARVAMVCSHSSLLLSCLVVSSAELRARLLLLIPKLFQSREACCCAKAGFAAVPAHPAQLAFSSVKRPCPTVLIRENCFSLCGLPASEMK